MTLASAQVYCIDGAGYRLVSPVCYSPADSRTPESTAHFMWPGPCVFPSDISCAFWVPILTCFSCGVAWVQGTCSATAMGRGAGTPWSGAGLGAGLNHCREHRGCWQKSPATWLEHQRTNASSFYDNKKIYRILKFLYFEPKLFLRKILQVWLCSTAGKCFEGIQSAVKQGERPC